MGRSKNKVMISSRSFFPLLLLMACAAEVAPRAVLGDPLVLRAGGLAALDGSYSEGDIVSYAWAVSPADGVTLDEADSAFPVIHAERPGSYTLRLEVCDLERRCDVATTWLRVDSSASAQRLSNGALDSFASATSGAGGLVEDFKGTKEWCKECFAAASGDADEWWEMCKDLPEDASPYDFKACKSTQGQSETNKKNWCRNHGCRGS